MKTHITQLQQGLGHEQQQSNNSQQVNSITVLISYQSRWQNHPPLPGGDSRMLRLIFSDILMKFSDIFSWTLNTGPHSWQLYLWGGGCNSLAPAFYRTTVLHWSQRRIRDLPKGGPWRAGSASQWGLGAELPALSRGRAPEDESFLSIFMQKRGQKLGI